METVAANFKTIKLRSSLYPNLKVLQIFGLWLPENGKLQTIYLIYGIILTNFIFTLLIVTEVISIVLSLGDMELMIQSSFLLLTHLAQAIKEINLVLYYKEINSVINSLDRTIFKPIRIKQYEIIIKIIKESKIIFYGFVSVCFSTCILWGFDAVRKNNMDGIRVLPISGWFPFNCKISPIYEIVFGYQIISTAINAATNVSFDTIVSGLLYHLGGQLDNLNDTLLNIKDLAAENLKNQGRWNDNKKRNEYDLIDDDWQMEMHKLLVHCVNHHRNILEMATQIGHLFTVSLLGQFSASALIICLTMFELSLVEMFSLPFIGMLFYQNCMLIEIVVYCWFGNEIILKSSRLSVSAYCSDWTNCSMTYKRNLLFLMVRCQVPIKLYAGNFFTLSIETLTTVKLQKILRTSWSYFAVLYQVHQK